MTEGITAAINSVGCMPFEKGMQIFQGNTTPLEDLIVRAGGYSAGFVILSKELQNDIIGRLRHGA